MMETKAKECPFSDGTAHQILNNISTSSHQDQSNIENMMLAKKTFKLINYQTNETREVTGPTCNMYEDCRHRLCTSTFMSLDPHLEQHSSKNHAINDVQSMSTEYIRKEAHDYQLIYHRENGTDEADYNKRLKEIDLEIKQKGTYTHTAAEIEYGCKLAWRNSARCINRLYWETLKVLDRRHVKTNDEMFKEISHHLEWAFNNGQLLASVLVLPIKARLWSTQYLRYACYEQDDGTLLGDPMNKELTDVAITLGWNKKQEERTPWDLLPVIVQSDPNDPPSWYEIPENLRNQVFLSHPDPKYNAIVKALKLRWVAQPFVCDKAIEIGGIAYKCVPFSGWFMGTEIGRDICDKQRYDMIPKIASLLNLDITTAANSQMNIDRIYVEINAAVLYSFQERQITIVDHHTAAAGFMRFMNLEIKHRGNVPADWVWLVPPISGGMNILFHQEMLNYVLKPRILDQHSPWLNYFQLSRQKQLLNSTSTVKRRHRWLILRAARVIIGFALVAAKSRPMVTVLYASATGTAHSYAQQMTKRLTSVGFLANLVELDDYSFQCTKPDVRSIVLIITSTHGQGNAPNGGHKVEQWLKKCINIDNNNSQTSVEQVYGAQSYPTTNNSMRWCTYSICAIGSSAYPFFCGFGKMTDEKFQLLGAQQLLPLATCDVLNQQYKSYNEWERKIIISIKQMYPTASFNEIFLPSAYDISIDNTTKPINFQEKQLNINTITRPNYIPLTFYSNEEKSYHQSKQIDSYTKENPYHATVLQNIELVSTKNSISASFAHMHSNEKYKSIDIKQSEDHSVRLISFDTMGLSYYPGDHVCIFPENNLNDVNAIIELCGWKLDNKLLDEPCSLGSLTQNKYQTIREILTYFVDIHTTLRPHVLDTIATYATECSEQRRLLELAKGETRYREWLLNSPTVVEILREFSSVKIPINELIQLLNVLQPRYYSISSSHSFHPNLLHITVSVVTYKTRDGRTRNGMCSKYLQQTTPLLSSDDQNMKAISGRKASKVRLFILSNIHFRLPGQECLDSNISLDKMSHDQLMFTLNCPILMFAVGSGIAPFRSFWQELQNLANLKACKPVQRVLFIGCRTPNDCLYADELQQLTNKSDGNVPVLTNVIATFSRTTPGVKLYVQDIMLDNAEMINSILTLDNSFIYICGSVSACQGIESALSSIYNSFNTDGSVHTDEEDIITKLKEMGRIQEDVFG